MFVVAVIARSSCDEAIQSSICGAAGLLRFARNDGADGYGLHTGKAIEYFTWLSAKLDSIEAMPSSRVSLVFRNAS